ncbi:hypothetical protein L873DRAFT_1437099 [Choiromyces venosus 120613-1]|uniref:Uncharacterized protein n=1 Tax=Choiromyces venosus 120613-1 TaxID=1336337 RepID=A0A3N4J7S9_9PEZI|nr:hypothetical protein L873DRAFT_1437099 [Choiromyces venosus 120613-1]
MGGERRSIFVYLFSHLFGINYFHVVPLFTYILFRFFFSFFRFLVPVDENRNEEFHCEFNLACAFCRDMYCTVQYQLKSFDLIAFLHQVQAFKRGTRIPKPCRVPYTSPWHEWTEHRGDPGGGIQYGRSNVHRQSAVQNSAPRIRLVFGPFMPDTCNAAKVGLELKGSGEKVRQPSQQEGTKMAGFKHAERAAIGWLQGGLH